MEDGRSKHRSAVPRAESALRREKALPMLTRARLASLQPWRVGDGVLRPTLRLRGSTRAPEGPFPAGRNRTGSASGLGGSEAGLGLRALSRTIHACPTQADAIRQVADMYQRTRLTPMAMSFLGAWLRWRP